MSTFKVDARRYAGDPTRLAADMANLAPSGNAFFYSKLPTNEVALCATLCRAGFSVIDTGITFAWAGDGASAPVDVAVRDVRSEDHVAVADIAEHCFRWSRFHLDPQVSPAAANRIKRRWIENYCLGQRGSALYVAEASGAVVGFLAVIESTGPRPIATIDLIGVSNESQGCGVGTALVRHFIGQWRGRAAELRVGTQAANIQSLRFYERNGFRMIESTYVLHAHQRDGKNHS